MTDLAPLALRNPDLHRQANLIAGRWVQIAYAQPLFSKLAIGMLAQRAGLPAAYFDKRDFGR